MFEYLMPLLTMPSLPGSILHSTYQYTVEQQIKYGADKKVPWGISESAVYVVDKNQVYEYHPNGVPSLGANTLYLDHLVIAPYASAMALMVLPA
jgi:cyclic beta-1,2-glucan synthetase